MMTGGTGQKLTEATVVVAGIGSLIATFMSIVSIWLQLKNYRKPLLQRYVVRILLMVPIYSISSWSSMISTVAAQCLDPIRDIYEAFTIYTFFQLLINYLDGERALIIMTHGREPIHHLWPMNHVLPPIDISDPHSFLAIKRGILQYALLKPILGLAAVIMKATGTYQEGYIGLKSGYFWSGIIYNLSVTMSLYSLGLFWVIMHEDLKPFRPVPKFLCVKLIIFASYWQGFLLSLLVWIGALPDDVQGYTPDNLAAAIQDALICIEMPAFAVAHWYAFSWHDFADDTVAAARMPVKYAARDAFGIRDLIEDSKLTFRGDNYAYRDFDSNDKILAHQSSRSRTARLQAGMRYERGGKGKYWIGSPDRVKANDVDPYTPLLRGNTAGQSISGPSRNRSQSIGNSGPEEPVLDPEMEDLYDKARQLEYGDWNYPVIPANHAFREERWGSTAPASYQRVPSYYVPPPLPVTEGMYDAFGNTNTTARSGGNMGNAEQQNLPPPVMVVKKKGKKKNKSISGHPSGRSGSHKASVTEPSTSNGPGNGTSRKAAEKAVETVAQPVLPPETTVRDDAAAQLWQHNNDSSANAAEPEQEDPDTSPRYDLQGDEFRNVWGSGH